VTLQPSTQNHLKVDDWHATCNWPAHSAHSAHQHTQSNRWHDRWAPRGCLVTLKLLELIGFCTISKMVRFSLKQVWRLQSKGKSKLKQLDLECLHHASCRSKNDSCAVIMHATSLSCLLVNRYCTIYILHHETHEGKVCLNMCVHWQTHAVAGSRLSRLWCIPHAQTCTKNNVWPCSRESSANNVVTQVLAWCCIILGAVLAHVGIPDAHLVRLSERCTRCASGIPTLARSALKRRQHQAHTFVLMLLD